MTIDEWVKKFWEILDKDCPRGTSTYSRTLTDNEAKKLCFHLFEIMEIEIAKFSNPVLLCKALLKTRSQSSQYDRAERIIRIFKGEEEI